MVSHSRSRLGLYAVLLLITGCFSAGGGGSCALQGQNGLAGNGSFQYECVGAGADAECANPDLDIEADLPSRPIARTASFRLRYLNQPTRSVIAASPKVASGSGTFTVHRAGTVGFFVEALNGTTDIEDAVRLQVVDPESVRIERVGTPLFGDPDLVVGTTERFRVAAFEKQLPLAGAVPGTWEVEPEGIVELEPDPLGTCLVRALAPGKVRLNMKAGGLSDAITIDVKASLFDEDAGTDADIDASTDATIDGGSTDASRD